MPTFSHPEANGPILTRIWHDSAAESGGGFFNTLPAPVDDTPGIAVSFEGRYYAWAELYSRRRDAMNAGSTYIRFLKAEFISVLPKPKQGDHLDFLIPIENTRPPQYEEISFQVAAVDGPDLKRSAKLGQAVYLVTTRED